MRSSWKPTSVRRLRGAPEAVAGELVGAAWVEVGRDPEEGLDCLGVVTVFFARLGYRIADPMTASRQEVERSPFCGQFRRLSDEEPVAVGDVILFHEEGADQHLGIAMPNGVLNATRSHGTLVVPWRAIEPIARGAFRLRESESPLC